MERDSVRLSRFPRPAVIVIDAHRGSLEPPGTVFVPGGMRIVPDLARFLDGARRLGLPVIYVVHAVRPGGVDAQNPFWMKASNVGELYPNVADQVAGSRWTEIVPELAPREGDLWVTKKRYGALAGTDLEFLLKNLRVETLVITGLETEICVLSTAFDAFNKDFHVVVIEDGVAGLEPDLHDAALRIIRREVGWVMPGDAFLSAVAEDRAAAAV